MSNPWFRMYSEFSHDPKVQSMSEAMQRRYVMFMCLRCSNNLVTLHETDIAFYLRISDADMAATKALFITKGFIDEAFNLLNWEKRQFASDTSAARVAKHRALSKAKQSKGGNGDVTLQKQNSNALDTEADTEADTEEGEREPAMRTPPPSKPAKPQAIAKPDGVKDQTWIDWLQLRKSKKAPVTQTTLDGAIEQAAKANKTLQEFLEIWCTRGSQGLEASWLSDGARAGQPSNKQAALEAQNRQVGEQWAAKREHHHAAM